ncbi:MAG TPA: hypothetical protein VG406_21090, partial [Isosphaeraceae bacterium]|nr:hypothetical protein [Isosphaeraceae bacterium]
MAHLTPNHATGTLAAPHSAGDGRLRLQPGQAALFAASGLGTASTTTPGRVCLTTGSGPSEVLLTILDYTGVQGTDLVGVAGASELLGGQVLGDVAAAAGVVVSSRWTDGLVQELRQAGGQGPAGPAGP